MTLREQRGGKRIISGGSKTVFGEVLYGMFSPPLSFPPPLFFSECSFAFFCVRPRLEQPHLGTSLTNPQSVPNHPMAFGTGKESNRTWRRPESDFCPGPGPKIEIPTAECLF